MSFTKFILKIHIMMTPFIAEFMGTAILLLLGVGVVANVNLKNTIAEGQTSWVLITSAWGFAVFVGAYATGQFSGAHLNPAVTVGLAVIGKFSWSLVPTYVFAQLLGAMPPLQTMESLLFEVLATGQILLSVALMTGFLFLDDLWAQHVAYKTILSLVAWFIFTILLYGHYRLGWRGRTAIRWTLWGFGNLALAFFGTKMVLEFLL